MATKMVRVCYWITEQDSEDLKKMAKSEHRSVSNLIRVWIAEHKAKQG